jgi:hypothetical protein
MSDHDELPDEYSEEEVEDVLDSEEEEEEELEDDHVSRMAIYRAIQVD